MATRIPLDQIVDNPFQPRTSFERGTIQSLADEMKAEGFWGTLQGRRTKNGKVQLVFGHRRLRALRLLKIETVPIDIVDLTDAQMALRSLEENLQREGLTDLEKADNVKRAVEIARAELRAAGKNDAHAIAQVADRLGFSENWVGALFKISVSMDTKTRERIEAGYLTAKTAMAAKDFGGDAYVKTLAAQGKEASKTGEVAKPTHMTVQAMAKAVKAAPEAVQEKLKEAIIAGDVTTPVEAEQKARRLASQRTKRNKNPPPDLESVLIRWKDRFEDWTTELKDLAPYMDYLEDVSPKITEPFRAAWAEWLRAGRDLLKDDKPIEPRSVGRGQSRGVRGRDLLP